MKNSNISTTQVILGGFATAIIIGAALLMLPISSNNNTHTDLLTALFTATSALCVTGLVVVDTATHWSIFGQAVILVLIQLGGMGIILVASAITILSGRKINLKHRATLQEALSVEKVGGIIKLTEFILITFVAFELLGAVALFTTFIREFDVPRSIWYSVFHSISAFCNAGFDIMGFRGDFSSLTYYNSNLTVNITIILLIIIGGIGFTVWEDVYEKKLNFSKYTLQTKIVFFTTIVLIILPAIYFYFFEFNNLNEKSRILSSIFQSVTTRTAGFNTEHFANMTEVGQLIGIALMFIGGSPCSTAGGIKTTTIAILFISCLAMYRRENEPHIFSRRIRIQIIKNAITIFISYFVLFIIIAAIICNIENISMMTALFETASAIGTVGLTFGITPELEPISKVLIMFLMFFGRVGGLTFIYAIMPALDNSSRYIAEDIQVG